MGGQFEADRVGDCCAIDNFEASADGLGAGNPIFGADFDPRIGSESDRQEVGIESADSRRAGKFRGVVQGHAIFGKTGKEAHQARTQAVGSAQRQRGGVAAAQVQLPNLIVDIIGGGQAGVGCEGQLERVAGAKVPGTHTITIVRGSAPEVKGNLDFAWVSFKSIVDARRGR